MTKLALGLLFSITACLGATPEIENQGKYNINMLANPGFEQNKARWAGTGSSSFTITTTAANVAEGNRAAGWDASASGEYLRSNLVAISPGLYGRNCELRALYKGGDANIKIAVDDGSSSIREIVLATAANYTPITIRFECPTSGNLRAQLESTADAAVIYLDEVFLGESYVAENQEYWDLNIGGANISCGTSSDTTYSACDNGSLDLVVNTGSQSALISCAGTTESSGLTCTAANEQPGFSPTIYQNGTYQVCFIFSHGWKVGAGSEIMFQIVETNNADQVVIQEGKGKAGHRYGGNTGGNTYVEGFNICGYLSWSSGSTGKKTIRLMREQAVSSVTDNLILADRNSAVGERDVHIFMKRL